MAARAQVFASVLCFCFVSLGLVQAQETSVDPQAQPVGVTIHDEARAYAGYTLFTSRLGGSSYLIDMDGRLVNVWESATGREAQLLADGNIIRTTSPADPSPNRFPEGTGYVGDGLVQAVTWDNEVLWEWQTTNPDWVVHHGIEPMPNGNFFAIVWEYRTIEEAFALGLNPDLLIPDEDGNLQTAIWPDTIVEVNPTSGEVVWQWRTWDHLVQNYDPALPNFGEPSANPGRVDINAAQQGDNPDWQHSNAISYNPTLDLIAISVRDHNEFWVIDHSISAEDAAGPAGDILYRWGNPANYGAVGFPESARQLYEQHDVQWIPEGSPGAGNILLFNNRVPDAAGLHSRIVEVALPTRVDGRYPRVDERPYGPPTTAWEYRAEPPQAFFSGRQSGTQRLPNGNTLITEAVRGRLFEVTPDGAVVWEYINPVAADGILSEYTAGEDDNRVFRARRYSPDHPALRDRDLTPRGTIEAQADGT